MRIKINYCAYEPKNGQKHEFQPYYIEGVKPGAPSSDRLSNDIFKFLCKVKIQNGNDLFKIFIKDIQAENDDGTPLKEGEVGQSFVENFTSGWLTGAKHMWEFINVMDNVGIQELGAVGVRRYTKIPPDTGATGKKGI